MTRAFQSVREILDELDPNPATKEREINMKDQLESLVAEMYASGILYSEALREFKKRFIMNVIQQNRGNQCRAAAELGMHRNTLSRTITELKLQGDIEQRNLHRGRGGEKRKLEKKYAPLAHVPKTLVKRKPAAFAGADSPGQSKAAGA